MDKINLLSKIFPNEEMLAEFLEYDKLDTDADKAGFMENKRTQFATESPEAHRERVNNAITAGENVSDELKELHILKQLQIVSPFISLSEISKIYFGKSRGWLSQRLHENEVRGRKANFKPEELNILKLALLDISEKLKNTALLLSFS